MNITLTVEKDRQKIEVTIPVKGTIIRAEQESNDMYVSIDLVEEIIERQLKKYKNKIVDKKQAAVAFSDLFITKSMIPTTSRYRQSKEIRYEADGSGRGLCTDGTLRT